MSNQNDQQSLTGDFVEKRRAALERYMLRTAAHPVLCVDPDFREFLECGKFISFISIPVSSDEIYCSQKPLIFCLGYRCSL